MPISVLHLHLLDLPGEEQGAFRHRVLNAVQLLSRDPEFEPAEISWLAPDAPRLALAADILILHGLAGMEIEALIRQRRAAGRVTLFGKFDVGELVRGDIVRRSDIRTPAVGDQRPALATAQQDDRDRDRSHGAEGSVTSTTKVCGQALVIAGTPSEPRKFQPHA